MYIFESIEVYPGNGLDNNVEECEAIRQKALKFMFHCLSEVIASDKR